MSTRKYYQRRTGDEQPERPFTTDGCSGGMSWFWQTFIKPFTKTDIPWRGCCVEHDREYWMGGAWSDRVQADLDMYKCVRDLGYPKWAWLMYQGIRLGGSPFWPFGWRWGYGYIHPLIKWWQRRK